MQDLIIGIISKIGFPEDLTNALALIASLMILIFIALLLSLIFNFIIIKIIKKIVKKTAVKWDDIIFNEIFLKRLTRLVPIIILYSTFNLFLTENSKISIAVQKVLLSLLVFFSIRIIDTVIKNANKVYETFPISKKTPIKGYIQLFQIFLYIIAVILIISILFNKDPLGLLSGIGALTAVLLLVFKDGILGFVAALQINANDMVNIGDWIEAPAYGADGDVIEISLTTIKVQNWDKTISTIPTYALVSGSFKNWRGMNEAKGRRIKRSLSIDVNSIKFLDQELINKLSAIRLLNGYLTEKQNEIDISNSKLGIDRDDLLNGRRLTNIGTFRAYAKLYIESHPKFNKNLTSLVRQLQTTGEGLPLEIYFFSSDTGWVNYEDVQSDIFDHLYSILPYFELRAFQKPGGFDIRSIGEKKI